MDYFSCAIIVDYIEAILTQKERAIHFYVKFEKYYSETPGKVCYICRIDEWINLLLEAIRFSKFDANNGYFLYKLNAANEKRVPDMITGSTGLHPYWFG